jgi:hypothetical protein
VQAAYGGGANLRAAPNQTSALVTFLRVGTRVEILQVVRGEAIDPIESRWWQVRVGSVTGYLYYKLVTPD